MDDIPEFLIRRGPRGSPLPELTAEEMREIERKKIVAEFRAALAKCAERKLAEEKNADTPGD